jgi:hypothetical protein
MRVDADVRADKTLALQLTAELVEPKGCLDVETKTEYRRGREEPLKSFSDRLEPNDLPAVPPGHRTLPIFLTRKLTAEVSLAPGQTIVLELGSGVEGAAQTTEANPAGLTIAPGQAIILEHGPGADGAASVTDAPSPARKDDPDQAKRRLFVFVTAKIAHPTIESFQASSSEARP